MSIDPEKSIKTFNVLTRIVAEIFNDLTHDLTKESLGLLAGLIMIIMCCCGKCGCARGESGKLKVTVGNVSEEGATKKGSYETKTPKSPKYKSIGGTEDESLYKLSQS
jgi:hypothetical protein